MPICYTWIWMSSNSFCDTSLLPTTHFINRISWLGKMNSHQYSLNATKAPNVWLIYLVNGWANHLVSLAASTFEEPLHCIHAQKPVGSFRLVAYSTDFGNWGREGGTLVSLGCDLCEIRSRIFLAKRSVLWQPQSIGAQFLGFGYRFLFRVLSDFDFQWTKAEITS